MKHVSIGKRAALCVVLLAALAVLTACYMEPDRVVDNQIKKLRNALGEEGKRIQTVVGRGYKISDA